MLILGNSGQGKSYFLKLLLCNILESGKRAVGLDPEGEYGGDCREAGRLLPWISPGGNHPDQCAGTPCLERGESLLTRRPIAFRQGSLLSQHISFLRDFFRSYKNFDDAQTDTIEIMLGRLYAKWGSMTTPISACLAPEDYPISP